MPSSNTPPRPRHRLMALALIIVAMLVPYLYLREAVSWRTHSFIIPKPSLPPGMKYSSGRVRFGPAISPAGGHLLLGHAVTHELELRALPGDKPGPRVSAGIDERMVWSLTFSPDGKWLACYAGGGIELWEIVQGKVRHARRLAFRAPTWDVELRFSPDGERLAASSGINTISSTKPSGVVPLAVWETASGRMLWQSWQSDIGSIAFSPDGRMLIAARGGRGEALELITFDAATGQPRARCELQGRVLALACPAPRAGATPAVLVLGQRTTNAIPHLQRHDAATLRLVSGIHSVGPSIIPIRLAANKAGDRVVVYGPGKVPQLFTYPELDSINLPRSAADLRADRLTFWPDDRHLISIFHVGEGLCVSEQKIP